MPRHGWIRTRHGRGAGGADGSGHGGVSLLAGNWCKKRRKRRERERETGRRGKADGVLLFNNN